MAGRAGFVPICQSTDLNLSILIVSPDISLGENLRNGLRLETPENEDFLKMYTCESVSQSLSGADTPEVDFVVFCIDRIGQQRCEAIGEIEDSLLKLDRALLMDRICLVCDNSDIPMSLMPKILHLKHKYQLHVLWADLEHQNHLICQRLKNLVTAVCGTVSGFPIISHRAWHGVNSHDSSGLDQSNHSF